MIVYFHNFPIPIFISVAEFRGCQQQGCDSKSAVCCANVTLSDNMYCTHQYFIGSLVSTSATEAKGKPEALSELYQGVSS